MQEQPIKAIIVDSLGSGIIAIASHLNTQLQCCVIDTEDQQTLMEKKIMKIEDHYDIEIKDYSVTEISSQCNPSTRNKSGHQRRDRRDLSRNYKKRR